MIRATLILSSLLFAACGGGDSGGSSGDDKLELLKVTALIPNCFKGDCTMSFDASFDVPWEESEAAGYMPVFAVGDGVPAPDFCDFENSFPAPRGILTIEVKSNSAISARGCAFNSADNYYSPGIVTGVMLTPPHI